MVVASGVGSSTRPKPWTSGTIVVEMGLAKVMPAWVRFAGGRRNGFGFSSFFFSYGFVAASVFFGSFAVGG